MKGTLNTRFIQDWLKGFLKNEDNRSSVPDKNTILHMWSLFLLRGQVTWRKLHGEFYTNFRSWEKNKTFLVSFNHWEGTAVIWADMTNFWQICFSYVKSEGSQIIYWAHEDKDLPPQKCGGGILKSEWRRAWCFGNCWIASAFKNENLS